jgi:NADPH:quinone reductase-like Zn-dependent oxidoreductase
MKALIYDTFGGPEVLHVAERPIPEPGSDDLVVRVQAATVGIGDCKARAGLLQNFYVLTLPKSPGRYGVGEVARIGAAVDRIKVGDNVVFATLHTESGSAAEYVRVAAEKTALAPRTLGAVETASLIRGATCAYVCLMEAGAVAKGEKVLIHGAAGSVGSACVELASHCGAVVTVTCRAHDEDYVRVLGANHVIAFDHEDFAATVRDQDLVVDLLGGEVHDRSYAVLRRGGRLVYLNAEPFRNRGVEHGVAVVNAVIDNRGTVLDAVCRLAEQDVFAPKVGKVLSLTDGAEAHRLVEQGLVRRGRVVLKVA